MRGLVTTRFNDLIEKGMMQKSEVSGRNTSYELTLERFYNGFKSIVLRQGI